MLGIKKPYLNLILLIYLASHPALMFANNLLNSPLHDDPSEALLIKTFNAINENRIDSAIKHLEEIIRVNPKFNLAQVVYGDLLKAKTTALQQFGSNINGDAQPLLAEARARWQHYAFHPKTRLIPSYILEVESRQDNIIVVDTKESRLFVYKNENGLLKLKEDYYISIGKEGAVKTKEGDKRTPIGVYFVTSFLDPKTLPDFYGTGAFPINYPNAWDRHLGRTGYGIWLHGNPLGSFSRPPRASDGCITLTNPDLDALKPMVKIGDGRTPVLIADGIQWSTFEEIKNEKQRFQSTINKWREDWESLDTEKYLRHYSKSFTGQGRNFKQWAFSKRRTNSFKKYIKVELDDVSIFRYPGDEKVMVVTYLQKYNSSNFASQGRKRQYWSEEDGRWRIIFEGPI
ncbi:MAG: L,D-transpeptidase family protein [Gammaproteobacteria bacterium]|nr:L,D-transpeptidase family protein [Gammaproteobacteria bacterium]MDH5727572.1 L,D-transpeptidase family protein [Gammaproteobacteria bacterium]